MLFFQNTNYDNRAMVFIKFTNLIIIMLFFLDIFICKIRDLLKSAKDFLSLDFNFLLWYTAFTVSTQYQITGLHQPILNHPFVFILLWIRRTTLYHIRSVAWACHNNSIVRCLVSAVINLDPISFPFHSRFPGLSKSRNIVCAFAPCLDVTKKQSPHLHFIFVHF